MTTILRWLSRKAAPGEPGPDELVRWRFFRSFRVTIVRGILIIIAANCYLGYVVWDTAQTGRRRSEHAAYQNCLNIEALRKTQRDQLIRSLKSYQRADVQKLLGPKLIALGRQQIHERLAELKPIDCTKRVSVSRDIVPPK